MIAEAITMFLLLTVFCLIAWAIFGTPSTPTWEDCWDEEWETIQYDVHYLNQKDKTPQERFNTPEDPEAKRVTAIIEPPEEL